MKLHRFRVNQHGLAILALAGVTVIMHSFFDITGFDEMFVAPFSRPETIPPADRVWMRVLLIHPELR